ncbi:MULTISPECIES: metal ABC transporter ATP-binding protein [unclassified Paenibacillus]|uniref:Metal ABC transporter ATP-binding protein n=1 Tax=Paenibacillus provencensis TaxID=441151 RepID=A0ABW3PJZ0_9BACL|nr:MULTISPECIES: metal ABC transporter ATP-binding protein [unclassified Paenibacillus]MCM3126438.1 metal ABC transporter ATP-binding protein [Paenibacillus sp. MER 78]SFS60192.1 zinc transport system ATP-binding protein [Paenibacillus sp. 453mf]
MQPATALCHDPVLELNNLCFSYGEQQVIKDLNMTVKERDFVGVIGSNGAGKTTLMRMLVGLLPQGSGDIRMFGTPIAKFKDWERIGYVPQKNAFNPLFPATVREVVQSGLYNNKNIFRRMSQKHKQQCDDALEVMRIQDLADKRIGQLSGGQQQRTFLARALINRPDLLILDEPTVGIDAETQASFFELVTHMHQHHHMTFLMVSHDIDMIEGYLGKEPEQQNGKIKFYARHSHDLENCAQTDLQHSLL